MVSSENHMPPRIPQSEIIIDEHGGADFSLKSVPKTIPIPIKNSAHGNIAGISKRARAKIYSLPVISPTKKPATTVIAV